MNKTKVLAKRKLSGQDQQKFQLVRACENQYRFLFNAGSFSTMQIRRRTQISLSPYLAAGVLVPVMVVPAARTNQLE
jgi:hypothetical protein